ncbi:Uncharacterised protein [Porphyromonas cangingivalis]|nr:Uncharacterised protein [Porphyromonas cangingivalis]
METDGKKEFSYCLSLSRHYWCLVGLVQVAVPKIIRQILIALCQCCPEGVFFFNSFRKKPYFFDKAVL